jgi:hypothetical protein
MGNIAIVTQTVTILDNTPPSFTRVPASVTVQCIHDVPPASAADALAVDNCGKPSVTVSDSSNGGSGSPKEPLVITRTYTATDNAGNSTKATQTITVIDDTPPVFVSVPAAVTVKTGAASTECGMVISDALLGVASAGDNCSTASVTRSGVPAGNWFPIGTTTITYRAVDQAGNTATATQTVTVIDDTPPVFTSVPAAVTMKTGAGSSECGMAISDALLGMASASDNCSTTSVTRSGVPAGNWFPSGATTITYKAVDQAGNTATATQTVTVIDDTPPVFTNVPPAVTVKTGAASTECGLVISDALLGVASASDNCSTASVTRSGVPAGNWFPIGATMITYTAVDQAGNTTTATQTVTVIDDTPPVFARLPQATTVKCLGELAPASASDVVVRDNCSTPAVTVSESSNSGKASLSSPLIITRTYTATDAAGNTAKATQIITVIDDTPPTFTRIPPAVTVKAGSDQCAVVISDAALGMATASDSCSGAQITRSGVPAGNWFPIGTTTITYQAIDAAGNTATATQSVTVIDETPPVFTRVPAAVSTQCIYDIPAASAADVVAVDNCGTPTVTVSQSSNGGAGSFGNPLIITRTYTATDSAGNSAKATQVITVADNTPPVFLSVPPSATFQCRSEVPPASTANVVATDNCSGAIVTVTESSNGGLGSMNSPLMITRIFTATDLAGNKARATQVIKVMDSMPPLISGVSVDKAELWPPNHEMVDITVNYTATDNCDGASVNSTLSVVSNEPVDGAGAGDKSPDWEIIDSHHLRLRAERDGTGDGRVYTITITATDSKGNSAKATVSVRVPKSNAQ